MAVTAVAAAPAGASTARSAQVVHETPAGSIGLRLLDAPASASEDPRARIYIVDHIAPSSVVSRRVEVSNTTASIASVELYPAAAGIEKGSFVGAEGRTANDVSMWTSVVPGRVDVPPGGQVISTVTITVPSDAAPVEHYGVVWAEARSKPKTGGGVTQVNRVGIRLYVSVGPGGPPAADFVIDTLTARRSSAGEPMVSASVRNTGGRALDLSGTLDLRGGPGGLSTGPFPAALGTTLAVGATGRVTIALDQALPAGPWDATIVLRSGLVENDAIATITFPAGRASPAVPATSTEPRWPKAAVALVIGGVLLALVLALALIVSRRRLARA